MKHFILLSGFIFFGYTHSFSQTLFTYGNTPVSKQEFLRAYNKNKATDANKEQSIREYIDLYANFKIKVKEAIRLHFDTLTAIKTEIGNFRTQIQDNYLSDEKGMKSLLDEAFKRSQKDLHVLHFFLPFDTALNLKYFQALEALSKELNTGNTNYQTLIDNISLKYPKVKMGDLGFISVFSVPYQYENIIYSLGINEVNKKPYQSKTAWHLFKVIDEIKSVGKWKVAQILLSMPPGASLEIKQTTKQKADSIYNLLKNGADFSTLALKYSDDKLTYSTGGEMPEFGTGKYVPAFEQEVFKLKTNNDITQPFELMDGYHIVKRINHIPTPTDKNDAAVQYELKQKILQNERVNTAKEKFSKDILSKIGFTKSGAINYATLYRYADSVLKNPGKSFENYSIANKPVLSFNKSSIKGADWLKFVKDYKSSGLYKGETGEELWNKYVAFSGLEYYKKHLEDYNEDFKNQLQEFKEGNVLFEIMERNVWSPAASDSINLVKLYNKNKSNYKWAKSADVLIVTCNTKKIAEDAMQSLSQGQNWRTLLDLQQNEIQVDSGRYELSQIITEKNNENIKENTFSGITINADGSAGFTKYLTIYPAGDQRNFDESRGLIINDYQNVLEQKWVEGLRKKYPVKINETVLKSMLK